MPTALQLHGWRFVVYPNDHKPAHVHVIGPGWVVVVDLGGPTIREAVGCSESEARRALRAVAAHREILMQAWSRYHG